MENAILVPVTSRQPRDQKEALEHKISQGLLDGFIRTLKANHIYVEVKANESRISYPDHLRQTIKDIAKRFDISVCICLPRKPGEDGLIVIK